MRVRISIIAVLVIFGLIGGIAQAQYYPPTPYGALQNANAYKDRGDYYGARSLYSQIANGYGYDDYSRRQASYWIGFCDVRLNDSWQAINDFQSFLRNYDRPDYSLVPDALYVLGRTYEAVGNNSSALSYYQSCSQRFPSSQFAGQSYDRMRVLGGGYYPPSPPPYNPPYPPPYPPPYNHGGIFGTHYSVETMPATSQTPAAAPVAPAKSVVAPAKAAVSNPYDGFTVDSAKIQRINDFVTAVQKMDKVSEAASKLAPEDMKLSIVKEHEQMFQEKSKFNHLQEPSVNK
ncbi:MAG: tetratricopeptide repeat protein [Candidatus Riflebacteria bacterium]|nr:tetratricopeptide repeat protein [Candidatus Riflebacteria bacterium]